MAVSPLLTHKWKRRYSSCSSVPYDHFQETFEKMLKECRMSGPKKKRKVRTGTRNTFQNEVFSGDSRNQVFPMPTENRARKDQAYFLKRSSRINTRKKLPIIQRSEWNNTGRLGLSFSKVQKSLGKPWAGKVKGDILSGYS